MPLTPALGRQRQENNHKFETGPSYVERSRDYTVRPCLSKIIIKEKQKAVYSENTSVGK